MVKKFLFALIFNILFFSNAMATVTFIPQGSALVPGILARQQSNGEKEYSYIMLSNITSETVNCRVTVYDHDGNDVTYSSKILNGSSSNNGDFDPIASGTGDFTIPPHSSRIFSFWILNSSKKVMFGHAVVEWNSEDPKTRKALIGVFNRKHIGTSRAYGGDILINNGQAF